MLFSFRRPSAATIAAFLERQHGQPYSYPDVGASRNRIVPAGYDCDHNRVCLGRGEAAFGAARAALSNWQMFRFNWVELCWPEAPIAADTVVGVVAKSYGGWWVNACRIVYVMDHVGPVRTFGFAYGTLSGHVERGEERFSIEWHESDDSVWYDLWAFSRPAHPLVKLARPLARRLQWRFAEESKAAMLRAVCD